MAAEAPNSSPRYLQGGQQRNGARPPAVACGRETRGGGLDLKKGELERGYEEKNITVKIATPWMFSRPNQIKP